jgi:hypothetical protein
MKIEGIIMAMTMTEINEMVNRWGYRELQPKLFYCVQQGIITEKRYSEIEQIWMWDCICGNAIARDIVRCLYY